MWRCLGDRMLIVLVQYRLLIDGQTDGQTDTGHIPR